MTGASGTVVRNKIGPCFRQRVTQAVHLRR